jgi:predicted DsbA family dithiol-disulfide isomerase
MIAGIVWLRESPPPVKAGGWASVAVLLLAGFFAPVVYGAATKRDCGGAGGASKGIPECVEAGQAQGMVTITEFFDLQCPHCRNTHFALSQLQSTLGEPVRVVRHHFPLPGHKQAASAARAAVCAEDAGFESVMMDMLFSADDLGDDKLVGFAEQLGLEPGAFRACMASAATARRLEDDHACGVEAGVEALPTLFIGQERFEGFKSPEMLRAAIARAKATLQPAPPPQDSQLGPQAGQRP